MQPEPWGFLTVVGSFLPLLLTLVLPGWLLLDLTELNRRLDRGQAAAISIGLSLAFFPVAMLWTTTLGLSWSQTGIRLFIGLLAGIAIFRLGQRLVKARAGIFTRNSLRAYFSSKQFLILLLLAAIFLAALALRLLMVRTYVAPAWVDSVHHGLIIRLILERGTFPVSYAPYLDIAPTNYHPGFHVTAAVFQWLSGLSLPTGLLLFGQVLNALAVLAVYSFTLTLTGSWKAGIFSALLTGFFTPMPAYYTSWGRYPELAGLLILPVLPAILRIETPTSSECIRKIALASLAAAGLFLVHYRVTAFLFLFFLAELLLGVLSRWITTKDPSQPHGYAQNLLLTALPASLLALPWLWPMLFNTFAPSLQPVTSTGITFFYDFSWKFLTAGLGTYTLILAAMGLLLAIITRLRFGFVFVLWCFLLFLLANLAALRLPGGGFVNNTSVTIALFMPVSCLGGALIAQCLEALLRRVSRSWLLIFNPSVAIISFFLVLLGAWKLFPILNPTTVLAYPADLSALSWIQSHLARDETVLINPFAWGYGLYAGSDGGYWITPLTGLKTVPPPVLYGSEPEAQRQHINDLCQQVIESGKDAKALLQIMQTENIHYVYTGVKGGPILPQVLQASGLFKVLYNQAGVWIFSIP